MPEYQLRCVSTDGVVEASCDMEAADDKECREIADGVLAGGDYQSIEVWKAGARIYRAAKPGGSKPNSD